MIKLTGWKIKLKVWSRMRVAKDIVLLTTLRIKKKLKN